MVHFVVFRLICTGLWDLYVGFHTSAVEHVHNVVAIFVEVHMTVWSNVFELHIWQASYVASDGHICNC